MHDYISKTEKYKALSDEDKKTELQKGSFKTWCTYVFLKNSDHNKYGSLKRNLQIQYALGNDQYPSTVSKMTDVLTNHSWDDKYAVAEKKRKEKPTGTTNANTTSTVTRDSTTPTEGVTLCTTPTEGVTLLTQKEKEEKQKLAKCFCCGEKGHYSPQCPKIDEIEHKDWAIKYNAVKGVSWGTGVSGFQTGIQWLQVHNDQQELCLHQLKKKN